MATSPSAELVGRVLGGRYRLLRRLGQGAFAQVYAADDIRLRRRVAIKVLRSDLAGEQAFLRRFAAEAQAVAGLRHPHIVRVYDWGDDEGDPYLVMELLEGGSVRTFLDQGHLLSLAQAARIGAEVASALDHAHRHGLVHRDIKPANLLFDEEGRCTVADFGLARAVAEASLTERSASEEGSVIGTARYAAPEQMLGQDVDHYVDRADVYSLALVLIESVTGSVPFASDTTFTTLMRRSRLPLRPDSSFGALAAPIAAAGALDPADRVDAAGLGRLLVAAAEKLPPPVPLHPTGPVGDGLVSDTHATAVPGRRGVFDLEAVVDEPTIVATPSLPVTAGPTPAPSSPTPVRAEGPTLVPSGPTPASSDPTPARAGAVLPLPLPLPMPVPPRFVMPEDRDPAAAATPVKRRSRRRLWIALAVLLILLLAGGAGGGVYLATRPPPTSVVPSLVGRTVAAARSELTVRHLQLVVAGATYAPSGSAGTVLSQQPTGGRLVHGRPVSVVVSKGPQPVPVPTLAGRTSTDAQGIINALGLKVGPVTSETSLTVAPGAVIAATPASGTLLPGQPIALVVSTGKPTVAVPTLSGPDALSYAAAQSTLTSLGLGATESDEYSTSVAKGAVIVTTPPPGATVTVGTVVTVTISQGPHLVTVPTVAANSVTTATQILAAAGFTVSGVTGNPTATVTGCSPSAGQSELYGSAVQLSTS